MTTTEFAVLRSDGTVGQPLTEQAALELLASMRGKGWAPTGEALVTRTVSEWVPVEAATTEVAL